MRPTHPALKTGSLFLVLASWCQIPASAANQAGALEVAPSSSISIDEPAAQPDASGWSYSEIRRMPAPEARQGVAVDKDHLYAISNHALGKYNKTTGKRVGGWECPEGDPLTHLNAGLVRDGVLYCAHSNFPGVPMVSSVEMWDTATMKHRGTRSFGRTDGSLTWIDQFGKDGWIACFVHYGRRGGAPDRGPEWTRLVQYDREWREVGGWVFPDNLMKKLGERGFSVSGGAFGPEGRLYVTGHDHAELYVLTMPDVGSSLHWVGTIPIASEGQAFSWDAQDPNVLYSISKSGREVIIGRLAKTGVLPTKASTR